MRAHRATTYNREWRQAQLPGRLAGFGLRGSTDSADAAYVASRAATHRLCQAVHHGHGTPLLALTLATPWAACGNGFRTGHSTRRLPPEALQAPQGHSGQSRSEGRPRKTTNSCGEKNRVGRTEAASSDSLGPSKLRPSRNSWRRRSKGRTQRPRGGLWLTPHQTLAAGYRQRPRRCLTRTSPTQS